MDLVSSGLGMFFAFTWNTGNAGVEPSEGYASPCFSMNHHAPNSPPGISLIRIDASAVQFTRHPSGIDDALKKINASRAWPSVNASRAWPSVVALCRGARG